MNITATLAQVVVALSVLYVWIFRLENVEREFREYHLSNVVRNLVGAFKISLSALLIVGVWNPSLVVVPALLMALMMFCAQIAHFRAKHVWQKYMPSFALLLLSLFTAEVASGRLQ